MRDLAGPDDARSDLLRSRHRLGETAAPARPDLSRPQLDEAPREWLDQLPWRTPAERHVDHGLSLAIAQLEARLDRDRPGLETSPTRRRMGGRGRPALFSWHRHGDGDGLLAELHDVRRFPHPRALMAFVG